MSSKNRALSSRSSGNRFSTYCMSLTNRMDFSRSEGAAPAGAEALAALVIGPRHFTHSSTMRIMAFITC